MGDSHLAALRQGWSLVRDGVPQAQTTFFAGVSADWGSVEVCDGKLVPGTERLREQFRRSTHGREEISGDFDEYVLCGLGLSISFPLRLWTRREHADWSAYRAAMAGHLHDCDGILTLAKLRQITARRIFVVASPFQPHDFCKVSPLIDDATAHRLHAAFTEDCEALALAHGAVFVPQPEATLAPNRITTRMRFSYRAQEPEHSDMRHGNAQYGAVVLTAILEALGLAPVAD